MQKSVKTAATTTTKVDVSISMTNPSIANIETISVSVVVDIDAKCHVWRCVVKCVKSKKIFPLQN